MMVQRRDDNHVAILRLEHSARERIPRLRPRAGRLELAFGEAMSLDCGLVVMEIGVEQREIEMLPFTGSLAVQERRADRTARMRTGADVTHRGHREVR